MSAKDEIIAEIASAFDELRAEFGDATLEFLKLDDLTDEFVLVATIEGGWFGDTNKFRSQFEIQIATADANFEAIAKESSNVRIGGEVYWIDKGETIPPILASPFWTFYCERGLKGTGYRNFR